MIKLILSWLIIVGIFFYLVSDKGIYRGDQGTPDCVPDYMGSCN